MILYFQITSVPCPATSRPELHSGAAGAGDHHYAFVNKVKSDSLLDNLKKCGHAISDVHNFEEWLSQKLVFKEKECSHLIEMEKLLLELAATHGVTKGVYYHVTFEKDGSNLTRYFESGSYDGLMDNVILNDPQLQGSNPYSIYTKTDVTDWAKFREETKKRKSEAQRKAKLEMGADMTKTRNRTSERYNDLLRQLQKAIAMFMIQVKNMQVTMTSFVVRVLRDNATQSTTNNIYTYVYGHDNTHICSLMQDHAEHGHKSIKMDIKAKLTKDQLSLREQFQFLSHIPNLHWKLNSKRGVSFVRCLSVSGEVNLPASQRNRYIHYTEINEPGLAREVFQKPESVHEPTFRPSTSYPKPAKKQRTDLNVSPPPVDQEEESQTEIPDVSSMTVKLSMYEDYV